MVHGYDRSAAQEVGSSTITCMLTSRATLSSYIFAPGLDALTVGEVISRGAYGVVHRGRLGARIVAVRHVKKIHDLLLDYTRVRKKDSKATLKSFHDDCAIM